MDFRVLTKDGNVKQAEKTRKKWQYNEKGFNRVLQISDSLEAGVDGREDGNALFDGPGF